MGEPSPGSPGRREREERASASPAVANEDVRLGTPPGAGPVRPAVPRVINVANGLTALRIILVPVFVAFMVASEMTEPAMRTAAALTFVLASLTDLADGWIARQFNLITSFGKVADPIADKALTGTALVLLSSYGALPWWVTALVLLREVGVTVLRWWVSRFGAIPVSLGGKAKTVLQMLAIGWYIMPFGPTLALVGPLLMAAAVTVTVATGVDYLVRALRVRARARSGR